MPCQKRSDQARFEQAASVVVAYHFAGLEFVLRPAVRAHGMTAGCNIEKNARVRTPERDFFGRAVQRQVFCCDFDNGALAGFFAGHRFCLMI